MKHVPYRKKRDTRPDRRQLVRRERGKRRAAQHETRPLQKEKRRRHPPNRRHHLTGDTHPTRDT